MIFQFSNWTCNKNIEVVLNIMAHIWRIKMFFLSCNYIWCDKIPNQLQEMRLPNQKIPRFTCKWAHPIKSIQKIFIHMKINQINNKSSVGSVASLLNGCINFHKIYVCIVELFLVFYITPFCVKNHCECYWWSTQIVVYNVISSM